MTRTNSFLFILGLLLIRRKRSDSGRRITNPVPQVSKNRARRSSEGMRQVFPNHRYLFEAIQS